MYLDPVDNVVRTSISVEDVKKLFEAQAQAKTPATAEVDYSFTSTGPTELDDLMNKMKTDDIASSMSAERIECVNDQRGPLVVDIMVRVSRSESGPMKQTGGELITNQSPQDLLNIGRTADYLWLGDKEGHCRRRPDLGKGLPLFTQGVCPQISKTFTLTPMNHCRR